MGQSPLNSNAGDNDDPQFDPTGAPIPDSSSMQSSNRQLTAQADPVADANSSARATSAAAGDDESTDQSQAYSATQQTAPAPATANPAPTSSPGAGSLPDAPAPSAPDTVTASTPRQRVRQIGQIPSIASITPMTPPQIFHTPTDDPEDEAQAQDEGQARANQIVARDLQDQQDQQSQAIHAQRAQIARINSGDPYQGDDGRWKKQMVDPQTGAINEHDIIDSGMGQIDTRTGNIYAQTSQGPQLIGVDPQQKLLAQLVAQKAQAKAQGSQIAQNIAAAQAALLDTQQQLQSFQGVPERMTAQIAQYTQASHDPANTTAADQLQNAQQEFSAWKAQHPQYAQLTAKRDDLTSQIQQQQAAKTQNEAQIAQLLTTPQYVQWNGNLPSSASGDSTSPSAPGTAGAAASPSEVTVGDVDAHANVIAAQTGLPANLAYLSALGEAKQAGAQTVDGSPIDDALKAIQPTIAAQLAKMTPPQLRQAVKNGLITKADARNAIAAQDGAALTQPVLGSAPGSPLGTGAADSAQIAPTDNGVGVVQDFAARVIGKFSSVLNRAGAGLAQWASSLPGQGQSTSDPSPTFDHLDTMGDLTKWFRNNAEVAEGGAGFTNPAMKGSIHATVADALGFTGALAAVAGVAEPFLPEVAAAGLGEMGGMSVAGRVLGFLGRLYSPAQLAQMLPGLAVLMPMASSEAYDAAKAKGLSDADATTEGMKAAAKQVPSFLLLHGFSGGASAGLKAALPGVVNPLLRGGAQLVVGAAANAAGTAVTNIAENAMRAPGAPARPILDRDDFITAMAFAAHPAIDAGIHEAGMPAMISKAQDIVAGSDPTYQALVQSSKSPGSSPKLQQMVAAKAAKMQADAANFLKANRAPMIAPGAKNDRLAQSIVDLHSQAGDLRNKIQTAFNTGGAQGASDLAAHRTALDETESQLHGATQDLVNRVPTAAQARIAKVAAPDLDWNAASQANAQDPMTHFATENLGAKLRVQDIPPDRQQAIRQFAAKNGIHPDLADHIANQAVGAKAVQDLTGVLQGGKIGQGRAETLKNMGFLQPSDPGDPGSPLHVTEDAQRLLPPGAQKLVQLQPESARYNPSPDPAHGSVLYRNAVAGMERFSKTAEQMLPRQLSEAEAKSARDNTQAAAQSAAQTAPRPAKPAAARPGIEDPAGIASQDGKISDRPTIASATPRSAEPQPSAAEKIRDEIASSLAAPYPQVLESRLAGHTPEEMAARFGVPSENAARASERVAAHVGRMMRERGVSAEDAEKALTPKPVEPLASGPSRAEQIRDQIGSTLAGRYPQVLESRLAGHTPEEMAARFGVTPENAARASERVATHVGRMMRERGVSAEDAEDALTPKPPGSSASRASEPSPAEKIRDEIGSSLGGPYPQVLESRLAGHTPEQMAARFGATPENAARASERVATHVGRMMRGRGVSAEDTEKALAPKAQPDGQPTPASPPAGEVPSAESPKDVPDADETPAKQEPIDAARPDASEPLAADIVRDQIASGLVDRYRGVFQARMEGKTPEEIAAQFGVTPENAARASDRVAAHIQRLMKQRGIDPDQARQAVTPPSLEERIDAVMNPPDTSTGASTATAGARSNPNEKGHGAAPADTPGSLGRMASMKGRTPGTPFKRYNVLRRLLKEHNVMLSVDLGSFETMRPLLPQGRSGGQPHLFRSEEERLSSVFAPMQRDTRFSMNLVIS
jgi:hypothetical protein